MLKGVSTLRLRDLGVFVCACPCLSLEVPFIMFLLVFVIVFLALYTKVVLLFCSYLLTLVDLFVHISVKYFYCISI